MNLNYCNWFSVTMVIGGRSRDASDGWELFTRTRIVTASVQQPVRNPALPTPCAELWEMHRVSAAAVRAQIVRLLLAAAGTKPALDVAAQPAPRSGLRAGLPASSCPKLLN